MRRRQLSEPGIVLVDGTVSFLRLYLEDELHELVREVPGHERFEWDIGSTRAHGVPVGLTHLIGFQDRRTRDVRGKG